MPPSALRTKPGPVGDGAGERAAAVAEQLGLQQRGGDRAAVDADERALAAGHRVERARDDLLAGAGLAEQEDRDVGLGHAGERGELPASAPSNVARVGAGARSAVSSTSSGAPSSSGPLRMSRNVCPSWISAPSPRLMRRVSVPLTTTPLRDCGSSSSQPPSRRRMLPWVFETRRSGSCSVSTRCPLSMWRRASRTPRPNRTTST